MFISTQNNSWIYNIPFSSLNSSLNLKSSNFFISEAKYLPKTNKSISLMKTNNEEGLIINNSPKKMNLSKRIKLPVLGKDLYIHNLYHKKEQNDTQKLLSKKNKIITYPHLASISSNMRKDLPNISFLQFQYMNTLFKENISKEKIGSKKIYLSGRKLNFNDVIKHKVNLPKPIYKKRKLDLNEIVNI